MSVLRAVAYVIVVGLCASLQPDRASAWFLPVISVAALTHPSSLASRASFIAVSLYILIDQHQDSLVPHMAAWLALTIP